MCEKRKWSRVLRTGACIGLIIVGACAAPEKSVRPGVNDEYKGSDVGKWVERFESESREIYKEREKIARAAGVMPGMMVADVGAGTGFLTELFSQEVGASGRVFAVDITPAFLAKIAADAKARGITNITTILGAEKDTNLAAGCADLVFVCDTYHHFEFPKNMLASIGRALRPGGMLVVVDFDRVPGKSRQWVIDHVRAGKDEVRKEIEEGGFEFVDQPATPFLAENYILRFRRPGTGRF